MARAKWKTARQRKAKKALAIILARSLLQQLQQLSPSPPSRHGRCRWPTAARSLGAGSLGALAVGALSMGAGALGALAIGRLAIKRGTVGSLSIDELKVRKLQVEELAVLSRSELP